MRHPVIIQGGMGVGVSDWRLARAVSQLGHLGVVSGTALAHLFLSRLRQGDPGGHLGRAMAAFPEQTLVEEVLARRAVAGPMPTVHPPRAEQLLTMLAVYCEVWLAKEGHGGVIGLNLLEKIQLPNLCSLYGAMLAGVDYVLMGAGIPKEIPAALDALSVHDEAILHIAVEDSDGATVEQRFSPRSLFILTQPLRRPYFLPIVASDSLAANLLRRASGRIDGFVVEGWTAGGHNAPPRGAATFDASGQPFYGDRDRPDLARLRALGLPFWLAGSFSTAEKLRAALQEGAHGVQVGTAFAFCRESGLETAIKDQVLAKVRAGTASVRTDPVASPTGFPFKVVDVDGSVSDPAVYAARKRICDVGYLRRPYRRPDGAIGYRCPGEPEAQFIAKGGAPEDMVGRKCLCNGLLAAVGHVASRGGVAEPALVTAGDELVELGRYLRPGSLSYSAEDVIAGLLC